MGEPRKIAGCSVLKMATAREYSRYKVVLCELPDVKEGGSRYVVWCEPSAEFGQIGVMI